MTSDRYDRPYSEWTDEDQEAEHLNSEAYLALGQGRADIVGPLVALLRSSRPIHQGVRDAIADALEGKNRGGIPIRLEVAGQNQGKLGGWAGKLMRFRRDLEIGDLVADRRALGDTLDDAIDAAAGEFLIGRDSCRRAVGVHRRCAEWLKGSEAARLREDFSFVQNGSELTKILESLYFQYFLWRSPQSDS
ncbi:MAG: hypothetical protein A4S16_03525 [Proteobacteria bacterium SG_bin6]|nr:MAG: hypothetical protein A4S16_03525 [Proteobacteria bacterium SG_bin6]